MSTLGRRGPRWPSVLIVDGGDVATRQGMAMSLSRVATDPVRSLPQEPHLRRVRCCHNQHNEAERDTLAGVLAQTAAS
jgi:hypothetical protein